jgi:YidC/Oxa1 family membrane protein insertase
LDKKVILLVVALGLLVIFWMPIMTELGLIKPAPQKVPHAEPEVTTSAYPEQTAEPVSTTQDRQTADMSAATTPQLTQADSTEQRPEETLVIETNVWSVTMSNYGGGPLSIKLKEYKYDDGQDVELLPDCKRVTPEFTFTGRTFHENSLVYASSHPGGSYSVTSSPSEFVYTYTAASGGQIIKRYRFYPDRYDYDLIVEMADRPSLGFEREYNIEWNNKLAPTELNHSDDYGAMWTMAFQAGGGEKFDDYDDNRYSIAKDGRTDWIATRSKYFTGIIIPRSNRGISALSSGVKYDVNVGDKSVEARDLTVGITMNIEYAPSVIDSFTIYAGPIDYETLSGYNNEVVDLVDIGTTPVIGFIIKIFAIPIIWLLPKMYQIFPNYGIVIILFSLAVKIITFPLTKKSLKSMIGMKQLQPKLEELKEKHKKNPQALNQATMKLYKEMGINPLSGCLFMLPQMPLFFALFAVFRSTILLRQAPFVFFLDDLSRGAMSFTDPYMILVVLMVVLMFLQQKPGMTDPKNKALTYIFPLMLGFFFYQQSAGLILYWTCFSLFSWIEQIIFKKPMLQKMEAAQVQE